MAAQRLGADEDFQGVDPGVSEPIPMPDIFATGATVQYHPEFIRCVYWVEQPLTFGAGGLSPLERIVVAKLVVPRHSWEVAVEEHQRMRRERVRTVS